MTARNFDALFEPRSIVLVGASDRPGSVGEVTARNLLAGGFAGEIMFVNPHGRPIQGRAVFTSLAALPTSPDLAVIATPAASVAGLIGELGRMGCRAAVVISAGFEGDDPASVAARRAILDAARPHLLRIVGPNCLGVIAPRRGVNASFARGAPPAGGLALVAQSGAVAAAALDWAPAQGLGFSKVVTLGDSVDVDVGDLVDYLGRDPETRAILLYVESLRDARKFMSTARAAARLKPVVVLKGGRSQAGAKAAFSHTRALAGSDAVYSAAFRRAGVLQVDTLEQMLGTAALLLQAGKARPQGLTILTNGGGAGVLAVDALERASGRLTALSPATREALRALGPADGARNNPVDVLGDAPPELYGRSLEVLLAAPEVEAVLAINCPTAVADSAETAEAVIQATRRRPTGKPVLTAWLGAGSVATARQRLAAAAVPGFAGAEAAAESFVQLARLDHLTAQLLEAPDGAEHGEAAAAARKVVGAALAQGRAALDPIETQTLLKAYGVPFVETRRARTIDAAGEAAAGLDGPVALKIQSPDSSHKSDGGGVQLGLRGADEVRRAAERMTARIREVRPDARLDGFIVQQMAVRPLAEEVLAGVVRDPTFGPVVMVGHGGVAVEVRADRAIGLPPLNTALAADMISRTRVARLLAGYRDRPPADLAALGDLLVALGRLASDLPEVAELDLNPVLCDAGGVLVLDARVAVRAPDAATARTALASYPAGLARAIVVGGQPLRLRPIQPRDAARLSAMVDRCSPDDRRLRFSGAVTHLDPAFTARLCQIDYDRQMALVLEDARDDLLGLVQLIADPEGDSAEFSLIVRSDQQDHGLGRILLGAALDYGRTRGLKEVWGDVACANPRMIDLARELGFSVARAAGDETRVTVSKPLEPAAPLLA